MKTIDELRRHCRDFGGFTGGWNVILETFKEHQPLGGPLMVVSSPIQSGSWLARECGALAREVEIGGGRCVIVIDDWPALEKAVRTSALRERLLVMITGNLFGGDWEKAIRFSGRSDGMIRRSQVGVPVGAPYWYPTEEQLADVE